MRGWKLAAIAGAVGATLALGRTRADDAKPDQGALASLAGKVNEIILENGLRVLVLERHDAPTIACANAVNVGSADETTGETGLAHMFEHMAFKGSTTVGTKDWAKERPAIDEVEKCFLVLRDLRMKGASGAEIDAATKAWQDAQAEAGKYVEPEEYSKILERNGGEGLNAFTTTDETVYHVELPSNRLELWFLLESDRFRDPVLREFYKEKQAVEEERRMRTDSSPEGKLFEEFLAGAFRAHPYGKPVIGWMSDIDAFSATTAKKFFKRFYTPDNMTISIVGDVSTAEVQRLAEKYFGPMPRGPGHEPCPTVEPTQDGVRRIEVEIKAQPVVALAWHCPAARDPDSTAVDALTDVLSAGRTARLHQSLVVDKKLAVDAEMGWGEPGQKYPNLIYAFMVPAPKVSTDKCVAAVLEEVERVKKDLISEEELSMVKTRARANFLRELKSNLGLAQSLSMHQNLYGDWKDLFEQPKKIEKLTREDLRNVARKYLTRSNMSRGEIVKPYESAAPKGDSAGAKDDALGSKGEGAAAEDDAKGFWGMAQVGATVEYKTTTDMKKPVAMKAESTMTETLTAKDEKGYTLKTEVSMNGTKVPVPEQTNPWPKKAEPAGNTTELGKEKLTVGAGEFVCEHVKMETDAGGVATKIETWMSNGLLVKSVTTNENMIVTTELTKLDRKAQGD